MRTLFTMLAMVGLAALTLATGVAPAGAHLITGTANDGYCSFYYAHGTDNGANDPHTYSEENASGCQWVDADLTSYYEGSTPRSKWCPSHATIANCQSGHNNVSQINSRVRGMDWEYGTWQTLYKYHG